MQFNSIRFNSISVNSIQFNYINSILLISMNSKWNFKIAI